MILKNAYASTVEGTSNNGWSILSEEGNPIAVLPQPCNEYTAMAAIHMGRVAEREAYKDGILEGKKIASQEIKMLKGMNEQLSTQLKRHMEMR